MYTFLKNSQACTKLDYVSQKDKLVAYFKLSGHLQRNGRLKLNGTLHIYENGYGKNVEWMLKGNRRSVQWIEVCFGLYCTCTVYYIVAIATTQSSLKR